MLHQVGSTDLAWAMSHLLCSYKTWQLEFFMIVLLPIIRRHKICRWWCELIIKVGPLGNQIILFHEKIDIGASVQQWQEPRLIALGCRSWLEENWKGWWLKSVQIRGDKIYLNSLSPIYILLIQTQLFNKSVQMFFMLGTCSCIVIPN